nr:MAG TPA: hypothetical protein [Caudoviricetes sp.]
MRGPQALPPSSALSKFKMECKHSDKPLFLW